MDLVEPVPNVSTLDFTGANHDGGGDNWSYKAWEAPVKMSPHRQTNTQFFNRPDALPVTQPTVSEHLQKQSICKTEANNNNEHVQTRWILWRRNRWKYPNG